jgi:DNA-directed RNA polymerase beta subunit
MTEPTPILTDAASLRERVRSKAVNAVQTAFPLDMRERKLEVKDLRVVEKHYSPEEQRRALLTGGSLDEALKGTLVLRGSDGKIIDEAKNFTIVHLPYLTERHTLVADGNEYQVANQLRRKPGVYTARADNGELKAIFNLGRGKNFDLGFEPKRGTFHLSYGTTNIPLYPVLKALGVGHDKVVEHLGHGVAEANAAAHGKDDEKAIGKLYAKLVHPSVMNPKAPHAGKVEEVRRKLDQTTLDPHVTAATLGKGYDKVTPDALLAAAKKVLAVHSGKVSTDDTDALTFKTFHSLDDFLAERIRLSARVWSQKAKFALNGKTSVRDALRPAPFSDAVRKFVTTSSLTAVPTGINPLELIDHAVKVTSLGEGGIPSDRAIPLDARMIHNTHFGALDPIRTPECHRGDGEVLTKEGWKRWDAVTEKDFFACRIGGALAFCRANRLIREPYAGRLYGVRAGKVSYLVTPNHRVFCAPVDRVYPLGQNTVPRFDLVRADEAHGRPRVFDTGHLPYRGGRKRTFTLPTLAGYPRRARAIDIALWGSFMGWFLSEGSTSAQANGQPAHVQISQSRAANDWKCAAIEALLKRLPFKWSCNDKGFHISHRQLAAYLHQFGFCDAKYIPEYFFDAPVAARRNLLETLLLGDGRIDSRRATGKTYTQEVFCTTSRRLAGDVERLAISLGWSVRTSVYADKREDRYLDVYEVRLLQDRYRQAVPRKGHYFTQEHDGLVYCATVPGGLLYVRQGGGGGHWSGNSSHSGVDIRATIAAHRDNQGNLYTVARNVRTGKDEFLKAGDLAHHVVAFAGEDLKGEVDAFVNGKVKRVPGSRVTHQLGHVSHAYSPATTLIPMIHSIQGNRAIMGSKMGTQALPLLEREAPFVQVKSHLPGEVSFEALYGHMVVPRAPVTGTVHKIEDGWVYIRPEGLKKKAESEKNADKDEGLVKVPYQRLFPFPSKTYLHHDLSVKPGDRVQEGQRLGESNFTRDGVLALGKNLRVAYVPYYGVNSNDAVVISEGCSKKLTSEHMYREVYPLGSQIELNREKHRMYYGTKYGPRAYDVLDEHGVVRKGVTVHPRDLLVAGLTKTQVTGTDALLGRISKALARPYQEVALTWTHGTPGEVVDVVRTSSQITVLVRTREAMQVGDKLAGRYGNKGVVAKIVPDHEMLQDAQGRPIDLLLTSAGVVSRINPAQVIETAVGKVVEKTGKPIIYDNNARHNAVEWATDLLKKHDVKDKEHIYDPVLKRHIKGHDGQGVLVGRQFIYKLFKSTDTNFAGHGVGPYDLNEQPLKTGGDDSAKGLGKMEFDALIAHNARNFLREAATIKGQKNDAFWKAIQLGAPLPVERPPFAFSKFVGMLEGAGLRVDKRGSKIKLLPMTDKDVLAKSTGALENAKTLVAKNLRPEMGGLFDPRLTGGPQGTLYAHIDLPEAIPHPVFKEPVRRLLGLSEKEFEAKLGEHGGAWFHEQLKALDVPSRLRELRTRMTKASGAELNDLVKQIKYLEALQKEGMKPHEAYIVSKVPVVPPVFRPILPQPNDPSMLMVADANKLYGHLMDSNHTLRTTAVESDRAKHRRQVFNAVAALYGTEDVENDELRGQSVKGFLSNIAGVGTPKGGFFQRKLMRRTQDVSGRGTAVPDANLGMDHVGLPEQMLWQMYDKLVVARLVRTGYPALDARERVNKKDPVAREALLAETKERPVLINRAPTLHRWSIVAAHPVPVQGKTIRVNPFIEKGMNLDYDGDTLQVHVPVTQDAIEEAKHMTLSNMLLSDQTRRKLMAFPQHEAIIGFTHASKAGTPTGPAKKFKTEEEAIAAWRKGALQLTDHIEIEDKSAVKKAAWVSDAEVLAALQEGREATPDLLATTLCWLESDDA